MVQVVATEGGRPFHIFSTAREMAHFALVRFLLIADRAIAEKGTFFCALSGGSSPLPFYDLLAENGTLPLWEKTQIFWADERFVPCDDDDSNYRLVFGRVLNQTIIPAGNIHRVVTEGTDPAASARRYEKELRDCFMISEGNLPRFDLIMLGIGDDGHTASLFPGSEALHNRDSLALAVEEHGIKHRRVTLTIPVINNAACVIFLVTGKNKAPIIRHLAGKGESLLPAALVKPNKGAVDYFLDSEASLLTGRPPI
jgi:6-phosphogluconolactonase